jgi:hypothetical protein
MFKSENEIIERLTKRVGKLTWGGWIKKRLSCNDYFPRDKNERFFIRIVGLKTILPKLLLKVEIRLFARIDYDKNWHYEDFNPKKHDFVYEIKITDELYRFKGKKVLTIVRWKGDEGVETVINLFGKARKKATFIDLSGREKKEKRRALKQILEIFA